LNGELIQKADELFQSLLYSLIRANSGILKKLGEIAEIIMGQSPPSSTYNERGEGLPFFQGKAEFDEMYPTAVKYCPIYISFFKERKQLVSTFGREHLFSDP